MELKATSLGKRLTQHPYDQVVIPNVGAEASDDRHEYFIPFNQLLVIHCKHGLVQGELESALPDEKVVRLHGTEWAEIQHFHHHLNAFRQQWSQEMSDVIAGVLQQQSDAIVTRTSESRWLTRGRASGLQQQAHRVLAALLPSVDRLEELESCWEALRQYQAWLKGIEVCRLQHNQTYTDAMLEEHAEFFQHIESSPLDPAQAHVVVSGEQPLLILAGAGSDKTPVLVTWAGWLLARGEATPEQILLPALGCKAAQEMDDRIRERLRTGEVVARTFHSPVLHITSQGNKRVPTVSELENGAIARSKLFTITWCQQCSEKEAQTKGWR